MRPVPIETPHITALCVDSQLAGSTFEQGQQYELALGVVPVDPGESPGYFFWQYGRGTGGSSEGKYRSRETLKEVLAGFQVVRANLTGPSLECKEAVKALQEWEAKIVSLWEAREADQKINPHVYIKTPKKNEWQSGQALPEAPTARQGASKLSNRKRAGGEKGERKSVAGQPRPQDSAANQEG